MPDAPRRRDRVPHLHQDHGALLAAAIALLGVVLPARAGEVAFAPPVQLASDTYEVDFTGVEAADLDGDGDLDVAAVASLVTFPSTGTPRIVWLPNLDGQGSFGAEQVITTDASGFQIRAARVDSDADVDVIVANLFTVGFGWWDNAAGDGSLWTRRAVTASGGGYAVDAADLDGDGDTDIVTASSTISWHESDGASPPSFTAHVISGSANWHDAIAVDLDGDADLDVLAVTGGEPSLTPASLEWFESDGGSPPAFSEHVIDTVGECQMLQANPPCNRVHAADIDGDGDTDVVFGDGGSDQVVWYENDGGSPPAFTPRLAANHAAAGGVPADVDGDGDLDLLAYDGVDDVMVWLDNDGASPPAWTRRVIGPIDVTVADLEAADLDGDGDPDVLASGAPSAAIGEAKVVWFENLRPPPSVPALPPGASAWIAGLVLAAAAGARWSVARASTRRRPPS